MIGRLVSVVPKAEAEEIKREIRDFLRETLKLELSEEKTLITHTRTCAAKFLGYEIVSQHADDKLDRRGQRQVNETIGLRVPKAVIEEKCALYMQRGKPAQRAPLIRESDYSILSKYQAEYRGIVQYYLLAHNVGWFNKLHWVAETSLLKTLGRETRSTVTKMAKKHKATIETAHGPRKCLQVVVRARRGQETACGPLWGYSPQTETRGHPCGSPPSIRHDQPERTPSKNPRGYL